MPELSFDFTEQEFRDIALKGIPDEMGDEIWPISMRLPGCGSITVDSEKVTFSLMDWEYTFTYPNGALISIGGMSKL